MRRGVIMSKKEPFELVSVLENGAEFVHQANSLEELLLQLIQTLTLFITVSPDHTVKFGEGRTLIIRPTSPLHTRDVV